METLDLPGDRLPTRPSREICRVDICSGGFLYPYSVAWVVGRDPLSGRANKVMRFLWKL